jgi:hypothetical protein
METEERILPFYDYTGSVFFMRLYFAAKRNQRSMKGLLWIALYIQFVKEWHQPSNIGDHVALPKRTGF